MKKDLLLLLIIILPAFSQLLRPGYFTMHDDLQATRQLEMDKCFKDGQFPCRWVPDLGYGYGYPLFNYYPPLPYIIGEPFHYLGIQDIDTVKIVGILGFAFCALFMYLLGREFWGRGGGMLASVIYTYAPYHSVDFYVRGAMNEFWAMALFPAIFYTSYKLIINSPPSHKIGEGVQGVRYTGGFWIPFLSLSVAGLMLSHNAMLLIFTPALLVWCLYWVWRKKSPRAFLPLIYSGLLAFGLAAFFTLPVLFEQSLVHVESLTEGYFNFLAHFVPISRIFWIVNWGYGASNLGQTEHLSFFLGYLQWLLPLFILISLLFSKTVRKYWSLVLLLLLFTLTALFMLHIRSTPIWLHIDVLKYLQFPWRFLSLAAFSASLLGGAMILINKKLLPLLLLLLLLLNANYFRPNKWFPDISDTKKFSGDSWRLQQVGAIFDYLPISALLPPIRPPVNDLVITNGSGSFTRLQKTSNFQRYSMEITTPAATVELQTFYFPGWQVWLDGKAVQIDPARDPELGRMQVDVTSGKHLLIAIFGNTPVRTIGNTLSVLSWLALPLIVFWKRLK